MYEFHGWVSIRETAAVREDENLDEIVKNIKNYINTLELGSNFVDFRPINEQYILSLAGLTNHKGQMLENLMGLYNYIAQVAAGSYGLLYILDNEDMNGKNNAFQVYVLARGTVSKQDDSFLSPFVPIVENAFDS